MANIGHNSNRCILLSHQWNITGSENNIVNHYVNGYVQRVTLAAILILISLLGMFGNSLVILAVCISQRLRTATNAFVLNLSIADFWTCFFLPCHAYGILVDMDFLQQNAEIHKYLCLVTTVGMYACGGCSIFTIALIALNRYVLIATSVKKYRAFYKARNVSLAITVVWILSLIITIVPSLLCQNDFVAIDSYRICYQGNQLSQYYKIVNISTFYPSSLLIMVVCYAKIFQHVKKQNDYMVELTTSTCGSATSSFRVSIRRNKSVKRRIWKRQLETTKNLFYIVLTFIVCYTPYYICLVMNMTRFLIPWTGAILLSSTVLNPLIYATKHKYFRRVFIQILKGKCADVTKQSLLQKQLASSTRASVHSEL